MVQLTERTAWHVSVRPSAQQGGDRRAVTHPSHDCTAAAVSSHSSLQLVHVL